LASHISNGTRRRDDRPRGLSQFSCELKRITPNLRAFYRPALDCRRRGRKGRPRKTLWMHKKGAKLGELFVFFVAILWAKQIFSRGVLKH